MFVKLNINVSKTLNYANEIQVDVISPQTQQEPVLQGKNDGRNNFSLQKVQLVVFFSLFRDFRKLFQKLKHLKQLMTKFFITSCKFNHHVQDKIQLNVLIFELNRKNI